MPYQITPNFTFEELTATNTGLDNTPKRTSVAYAQIKAMARVLQQARDVLGKPIFVNSCYRSPLVNAKVGGSRTSHHLTGSAVDISIYQYTSLDKITLENALRLFKPVEFIKYDTFWHIAYDFSTLGNHGEVSTYDKDYPELYDGPNQVEDL